MHAYTYPSSLLAAAGAVLGNGRGQSSAQPEAFTGWPPGAAPHQIGKRVAENLIARPLGEDKIHYAEACTWYGSLTLAALSGDEDLRERLVKRYDPLLSSESARLLPPRAHVDDRVFGIVPLEIFIQTKDERHLKMGIELADLQWDNPTEDGITREARYWIDDMYMITALQMQALRATGDARYLDRAARTMAAYLDRLQQPNALFYHTPDSPLCWNRGNGWVAAGMTELLRSLPAAHPQRGRILGAYAKMMASLLRYQDKSGLWRQLIDQPQAWPEASGTGMFAFAMVTGTKNGWLDAQLYGPAARRAWLGLTEYLDGAANVREVCGGTNQAFAVVGANPAAQLKYYLDCPRLVGDLHGQAPILWTASALLR
jgi:unsaturated rhamnogalacturonyl hydrolase